MRNTVEPKYYAMNSFRSEIKTHLSLLTQISNSVKEKLEEIFVSTRRSKRGLIDGLGSIFKAITGNLDSSDGQFYTDSINKLNNDQHQIENLLKNQILVTESVIKNFNETIYKLQVDEQIFNSDIEKIEKSVHQITDKFALVEAKLKFFEICEQLMESYLYIEDSLNDILNSITFARLNIIHSSIITPEHLINSLQEISKNLVRNNLPLPIKYSEIAQYLEIIELEAFQTQSDLVFILKIPLVEQQLFTLYHLYPIPILDNRTGLHHMLSFSQNYIAKNDDSLMYIPLRDISDCKQLKPKLKLCPNVYAYPIDNNAPCEAQLLRKFKSFPENCENFLIFGQGYHVQKLERNMWLVIAAEPVHVTVNCLGSNSKTVVIDKNFIFTLQPSCHAYVGITKVQAETQREVNITHNHHPVLIPYECCKDVPERFEIQLKPLQLNNFNTDDLDTAKSKLDQYSRDLDQMINKPPVTKHIPWITYGTACLVIGLLIVYTFCKCKNNMLVAANSPPEQPAKMSRFRGFFFKQRPTLDPGKTEDIVLQPI